eukprot:FR743063.1.p1 GENE.FR743063.1~~FR743063.1.p1  ORF type:complete len:195 (+),score=49.49 FR743063.1:85-585(+)
MEEERRKTKRPAFSVKMWHHESETFMDPPEDTHVKVEETQLKEAFRAGRLHGMEREIFNPNAEKDKDAAELKISAGSILHYFVAMLNPDGEYLSSEEMATIEQSVAAMREHEGLMDDHKVIRWGYLSRGKPYKRLMGLMSQLGKERQGSSSLEEGLTQERDLLADL